MQLVGGQRGELGEGVAVGAGEPAGAGGLGEQPDQGDDLADGTGEQPGLLHGEGPGHGPGVVGAPGQSVDLGEDSERVDRAGGQARGRVVEGVQGAQVVGAHGLGEDVDDGFGGGDLPGGVGVDVVVERGVADDAGGPVAGGGVGRRQARGVDDGQCPQSVIGECHIDVGDAGGGHAEAGRDHAVVVEREAAPLVIAGDDVDAVGRAVPESGDHAGALAGRGRGDTPADKSVY